MGSVVSVPRDAAVSASCVRDRVVRDHGDDFELFVTGDVHGDVYDVRHRLDRLEREFELSDGDSLVWLGDFGFAYGRSMPRWRMLDAIELFGERTGVRSVVMRGNHDSRYCRDIVRDAFGPWHVELWCGTEVLCLDDYPNAFFLPDAGSRLAWRGLSVLAIPGAFSVDGEARRAYGWPYEPEETLTWDEWEKVLDLADAGVDAVLSHTCPESWVGLFSDLLIPGLDQSKVDRSMERGMDAVLSRVGDRCQAWLFGHFHDDRSLPGTCGHMLMHDISRLSDLVVTSGRA